MSFRWFLYLYDNSGSLGDVNPVCFVNFLVCCSASNVNSHSLWKKYPNDALHGSSRVLFHCELMPARRRRERKKSMRQPMISVFFCVGFSLIWSFPNVWCVLVVQGSAVSY